MAYSRARVLADYVGGGTTSAEFDVLDGLTTTTAELNILDGVTSTTAELNIMDGVTSTTAELNYVDGVTSNVQTQLNAKAPLANPTFTGSFTSPGIDDNADAMAITIDSDENIGIKTNSPSSADSNARNLVISSATPGITIRDSAATDGSSYIKFADTAAWSQGAIQYWHGGDAMLFYTNGANERMRITSSGFCGIGFTTPAVSLQVNGSGSAASAICGRNSSSSGYSFSVDGSAGASRLAIGCADGSGILTERMCILSEGGAAGNVGVGTTSPSTKFHCHNTTGDGIKSTTTISTGKNFLGIVYNGTTETFWVKENGDIYYSGSQSSDRKMKENIVDSPYGLSELLLLTPRQFNFIGTDQFHQGFIAQETEEIVPNMTNGDSSEEVEENMSFDYNGLTAVLVKAVQELSAKVTALENA